MSAPILLGLLNFDYVSRRYGHDRFAQSQTNIGRALIGADPEARYLKDGRPTVLSPRQDAAPYRLDADGSQAPASESDPSLLHDAIACYSHGIRRRCVERMPSLRGAA